MSKQKSLEGVWRLVSSKRTDAASGETFDNLGPNPRGCIIYRRDGQMMVMITGADRPKPASVAETTSAQRDSLFSTMVAYSGTYSFDGKTVRHHIDLAWNEMWSGTTQVRDVRTEGDRMILTTRPAPGAIEGKMGSATMIWEKVTHDARLKVQSALQLTPSMTREVRRL
jgi:hypothetical protein